LTGRKQLTSNQKRETKNNIALRT